MSAGEWEVHVDPMLFFALVIEDQMDLLDVLTESPLMGDMGAIAGFSVEGVADIAREKIESAQVELDKMIEADDTWRPAKWSGEWCRMVFDGTDTDGSEWNRCVIHDELVLGDAYICEGYIPPPYVEGTGRAES